MTFTTTVAAVDPSLPTPTGSVQFLIDGAEFGLPVPLNRMAPRSARRLIRCRPASTTSRPCSSALADGNEAGSSVDLAKGYLGRRSVDHHRVCPGLTRPFRITMVGFVDVTFSTAVNVASFSTAALSLTRNNQSVSLPPNVIFLPVSGTTYRIGGLDTATAGDSTYVLSLDPSKLSTPGGATGSGVMSVSWLVDLTAPTSQVSPLPKTATIYTFNVTTGGSDPAPRLTALPRRASPPMRSTSPTTTARFAYWTTVFAKNPSAPFTGQAHALRITSAASPPMSPAMSRPSQ